MMEDFKPKIIACRCGWQGEDQQLITVKNQMDRYCPDCARVFAPMWPVYGSREVEEK